ncbi:MAG: VirB3 family type IV secretion system protein [Sphingomonas sp.]
MFLIFHSIWVLAAAALIHVVGMILCVREPRFFDLWLTKVSRCPRVRNYAIWRCNSYRP